MSLFYAAGRQSALRLFGLEKQAVSVAAGAPLLRRAGWWLRGKAPTISATKRFLIGDPRKFGKELMQGKATGKGSLLRQSFHAPDTLSKVLFYGLPAVEASTIAMDAEPDKAKRVGRALGGAALGLAAWRPLGMVGSMAADTLGRGVGGVIGQTAGHLAGKVTPPRNPDNSTTLAPEVAQAGRATGAARQLSQTARSGYR